MFRGVRVEIRLRLRARFRKGEKKNLIKNPEITSCIHGRRN